MFKVKVVGDYIARSPVSDKEKIRKQYEVEGNIPSLVGALSVVKNKLLAPLLAAKYKDYVSYLTYNIVQITPLDVESQRQMGKSEVTFMNREQLLAYIRDNALPVDAKYYPNLFRLREAVQLAKEDPEGYKKQFALREPELRLDLEVAACNPGLYPSDAFTETPMGMIPPTAVPPQPKSKASFDKVLREKTDARLNGLAADMTRDGELGPMDAQEEPDL
jgi:hypothetical protein